MSRNKILRITTIPLSLEALLKGQLKYLNQYFQVVAVSSSGEKLQVVTEREGVRTEVVEMEREISVYKDLNALFALRKLFKKEKPDIVHANTPKASLLSMIAGWMAGVPNRIYNVTGLRFEGLKPSLKRNILIWMERLTCFFATEVIPEGKGVAKKLREYKITNKPLEIIANGNINGIDIEYFSPLKIDQLKIQELKCNLNIEDKDFVFCFIGRCVIDKGLIELVTSFKKLHKNYDNIKLLLVGIIEKEGNMLPNDVIDEIRNNKNIVFTDAWVEDVRPYLAISNVFTFPSYREGFPNVVLQAGAIGLPVIASNVNGADEIIEENINGWIIPIKNAEALQQKMQYCIDNKQEITSMKNNCITIVQEKFDRNIVWKSLKKRYEQILHSKP